MEMKQRRKSEKEIDIMPLLKTLLSRVWMMILVGLIAAGAVFGVTTLTIKPTYRCGFTAYVNNQHSQASKDMLSNSDLIAAQQLVKTFSYIIRSNSVLQASLKSIDSDIDYHELSGMVTTQIRDETELITVYVENEDPQLAYELADAIAKTAPSYVSDIVEGSSMKIVDYPEFSNRRYKPNYLRFSIIGFLVGALLVAVLVTIRFFRDDTIKNESELETRFALPVLGVIPDINQIKDSGSYYSSNYGNSYAYSQTQKTE